MGSLCKPKSTVIPTTSTQTTSTALPAYVEKGGEELFEQAKFLAQQPYQPYTGQRVPELSPLQQQGITAAGVTGIQDPALQRSAALIREGGLPWTTATAAQYANPFQSQVIDDLTERMNTQFDLQRQQQQADAVGRRAFGGAREDIVRSQLAEAQARALGGVVGDVSATGYDTARAAYEADQRRRLAAGEREMALGQAQAVAQTGDINRLMGGGALERAQTDAEARAAELEFYRQQGYPEEQLKLAMGALTGIPYSTTTTQTGTGQQVIGGTSPLGQIAGGIGALGTWFTPTQ